VKKVFPASEGVADFCCATKVAPLRNAACFVAQQTVRRCARELKQVIFICENGMI